MNRKRKRSVFLNVAIAIVLAMLFISLMAQALPSALVGIVK
jgi:hypothetical protein